MDILSQLLGELRVESSIYCRFALGAGCGLEYPSGPMAAFHLVTAGRCWLVLGDERHPLAAGDFVVLPRGDRHWIQSSPSARVEPVETAAARARQGRARVGADDGEPEAEFICGALRFGASREHPLLSALPPIVRVHGEDDASGGASGRPLPWLATHVRAVIDEACAGAPGAETIMARLSEVLFVHAVRHQLAELPAGAPGWLGALRDGPLAKAIGLIHRRPEHAWTVAALGREVGLSRSQFAERFAAVVGQPPLAYLAAWRMYLSRALLRDGVLRVGEVARRVGYGSEAAFSTAFKRAAGVGPREYRRGTQAA